MFYLPREDMKVMADRGNIVNVASGGSYYAPEELCWLLRYQVRLDGPPALRVFVSVVRHGGQKNPVHLDHLSQTRHIFHRAPSLRTPMMQ